MDADISSTIESAETKGGGTEDHRTASGTENTWSSPRSSGRSLFLCTLNLLIFLRIVRIATRPPTGNRQAAASIVGGVREAIHAPRDGQSAGERAVLSRLWHFVR